MKTLMSILALGIVSFFGYAQETENNESVIELEGVEVLAINTSYLSMVQDDLTPQEAARLQHKAATYDIRDNIEFSKDVITDTFEMAFKNSKGSLYAYYDHTGKIETSIERFKDIVLPRKILLEILNSHKGWNIVGNLYVCNYDQNNKKLQRFYKVLLRNGDTKKNLEFNL